MKEELNFKTKFNNLRSDYFLEKIMTNITKKKSLEIIKYNKNIQKRLKINIDSYKEYSEIYSSIEIELIPEENKEGYFIHIKDDEFPFFHMYLDNKLEIKRTNLKFEDKPININIIIDYHIKSFNELFYYCECIKSINFKKFYRTNINNMSCMFQGCSSLKEINFNNCSTTNVIDMSNMFDGCFSIKEINISYFNTDNVTNIECMFNGCSSLKKINLSNFNTNKVVNMARMFDRCSSLKEINLSNFNTNNVINMNFMFNE